MEEQLIAPCGMNCGLCVSYLAMKNDLNKKGFARKYCPGCRPRGKNCTFMVKQCDLVGKGLVHFCNECDTFPCRRLKDLDKRYRTKYHMSMIENLDFIKNNGIEKFLEKEKAKWRCPECSGMICCHNGLCLNCSIDKLRQNIKIPLGWISDKKWQGKLDNSLAALLATNNQAVIYFARRDLLGEAVDPIQEIWGLNEPQEIIKKQSPDGSWPGPIKKQPIYPENHAELIATFKAFRILVERYQFTRESISIEKAAEYIFSFQTPEGDIRGFIGNQYATYYTGYILALLIQAGYVDDPRVENGMRWLLRMRQDDSGWTIPILTHHFDGRTMYRLTSSYAEPVEPVRSQPFSHNWTDMVLRAFAVHPWYRQSEEAKVAGGLLKSRFFQPDVYSSYKAASYWTRFLFWWPNLLTAMESLSLLGFVAEDPDINKGLQWFFDNRKDDGLWECSYGDKKVMQSKSYFLERVWISLRICRMLKHVLG